MVPLQDARPRPTRVFSPRVVPSWLSQEPRNVARGIRILSWQRAILDSNQWPAASADLLRSGGP